MVENNRGTYSNLKTEKNNSIIVVGYQTIKYILYLSQSAQTWESS